MAGRMPNAVPAAFMLWTFTWREARTGKMAMLVIGFSADGLNSTALVCCACADPTRVARRRATISIRMAGENMPTIAPACIIADVEEIKSLGRYEVKGVLGKGAMGLVYD